MTGPAVLPHGSFSWRPHAVPCRYRRTSNSTMASAGSVCELQRPDSFGSVAVAVVVEVFAVGNRFFSDQTDTQIWADSGNP